jgi:hypothetical protein
MSKSQTELKYSASAYMKFPAMRIRLLKRSGDLYEKLDHQLYTNADTSAANGMDPIITPHNEAGAFSSVAYSSDDGTTM